MSDKVPRVFISATTRDLGSYRKAVGEILVTLGALPVVQDHFGPDYRSVVEMLREKVDGCDAAICLVGRHYGAEPLTRAADAPRRSYTQLEYEAAVERCKRVFVFVAADDCPPDHSPDEPDELLGLQLEHVKRVVATDTLWMTFRSLAHLTDQVRVMRFDPHSLAEGVSRQLVVLMRAELADVQGEGGRARRGDETWVREVVRPFQSLLQRVLKQTTGRLRSETEDAYEANFETADAAVTAALALHRGVHDVDWHGPLPGLRVGIHVGQIVRFGGADESREFQVGRAMDVCRRLTGLAAGGQTLLTRGAFDIAREYVRPASSEGRGDSPELKWLSHGRYLLAGLDESQEICEVGLAGAAPLTPPPSTPTARRADSLEESQMQGWRPALGQEIPRRPGWIIERKLGEGGFGEVWLSRHDRTKERRVFKFCFDPSRLTSFKRELTLFKLLRDALGRRDDIARLLEVELDEAPFYLESEYVEGGNLRDWGTTGGHLAAMPVEERLRLVAEIAAAVAAAHSVGIIHKDLKPTNIFMRQASDGRWHPMLADFGIGAVADRSQLEQRGITVAGFTNTLLEPGSSRTGTRMYQPPEANLARPATVQGDIYALGVLLFQAIVGDFDQPLGHGWERRLEAARCFEETPRSTPSPGPPHPGPLPDGARATAPSRRHGIAARPERSPSPSPRRGEGARRADEGGSSASEHGPLPAPGEVVHSEGSRSGSQPVPEEDTGRMPVPRNGEAEIPSGPHPSVPSAPAAGPSRRPDPARDLAVRLLRDDIGECVEGDPSARLASAAQLVERLQTLDSRVADDLARQRAERAAVRMRRLRAALAASIAALLVVGGLGFSAYTQWRRAEALQKDTDAARKASVENEKAARVNADAARQQGQLALDTLSAVIFDIERSVENLPGSSLIRQRLLSTALKHLESLSGEFVKRSTADRHTAAAFLNMGDLVLRFGESTRPGSTNGEAAPGTPESRGALESACRLYTRSTEILLALVEAEPNITRARDLSISYERLGDVHLKLGDSDEALQYYRKSLEFREALAQADPNDAQARRDLTISYNNLGDVHLMLGDNDRALQWYSKGLELSKALAQADPKHNQARRDLAVSYGRHGDVHLKLGDTFQALRSFRKELELSEDLAQADPNDARARRDLSVSYNKFGDVYLQLGETVMAFQFYRKGLELREALAQGDPNDAWAQRDLSVSYDKFGDLQLQLGNTERAIQYYRRGLELRETLAQADLNDAQAQSDISISYCKLAQVYEKTNDLALAREWDEKVLGSDRRLSERIPRDASARRRVAGACENLCRICARAEDWPAAIVYAQQGLEHAREASRLAEASQQPFQWDFAVAWQMLAEAQIGAGQFPEARQSLDEAIKAGPKSADSFDSLAWLLATHWADAIRDGKKAVDLATKACEATVWKDPAALDTLAAAHAEAGQFDEAMKRQKQALENAKALKPADLEQYKQRLKLYESRKPYHQPKPTPPGPAGPDRPPAR